MKHIQSKKFLLVLLSLNLQQIDWQDLKVPAFKIGSGECNNFEFVKYLSKFKIPIIMSTGMNTINGIKKSVDIILKKSN